MFRAFAIILDLASGSVTPVIDAEEHYRTYSECAASMQQRIEDLAPVMLAEKREKIVGLGCIKLPDTRS